MHVIINDTNRHRDAGDGCNMDTTLLSFLTDDGQDFCEECLLSRGLKGVEQSNGVTIEKKTKKKKKQKKKTMNKKQQQQQQEKQKPKKKAKTSSAKKAFAIVN